MAAGVPSKDSNIIVNPEGYEDMVAKLKDREDEQLQRVLEKRKVETAEDLAKVAEAAIVKRATRTEHRALKESERVVLVDPKSPEIKELRDQLNKEIDTVVRRLLTELPSTKVVSKLTGRITQGAPGVKSH